MSDLSYAATDHTDFLKSLPAETRANLTAKTNRDGLRHLALHAGLILIFGLYIAVKAPLWWLILIPQGILIVFLFTLLHETVHFTPFAQKRLNTIVGQVCSVLILVPNTWFRYFHLAHHKHTNDPENDPELESGKPQTRRDYIRHISGAPLWSAMVRMIWGLALGRTDMGYLPKSAKSRATWEARAMIALYLGIGLAVLAGHTWLFWVWIMPILLGQPFLRLYLMAEHGHCPPVANMFENTRTTFTNRVVRFLAWNMPYHTEHHVYPAVPFHKLPEFHDLMRNNLKNTSDGYIDYHQMATAALKA